MTIKSLNTAAQTLSQSNNQRNINNKAQPQNSTRKRLMKIIESPEAMQKLYLPRNFYTRKLDEITVFFAMHPTKKITKSIQVHHHIK